SIRGQGYSLCEPDPQSQSSAARESKANAGPRTAGTGRGKKSQGDGSKRQPRRRVSRGVGFDIARAAGISTRELRESYELVLALPGLSPVAASSQRHGAGDSRHVLLADKSKVE